MTGHEMKYFAGLLGNTEPGWRCSCGRWSYRAKEPIDRTEAQAKASFRRHEQGIPGGLR